MNQKVVTRFAPSPTGFMHVGGVRTALFAWAFARQKGGTFILRIEDTDKAREVPGSIAQIIDSLKWLGIEWDEGPDIGGPHAPYKQSERLESYKKYANTLVEKGLAYADPYTKEELDEFRKKAEEEKKPFLYRNHRPENPPVWDGSKPLRLKITNVIESEWHDLVRGDLKAGPEALDDFILMKSDGYPTYNFAHIIDDLEMGATHIFRADEFISSVPNYLALYKALEIERPHFATLPPIMGPDGKKKLGKRDGAKDILDYKKEGYLPEAMMNFLAFIGWNPGGEREIFTSEEFVKEFSVGNIQKGGAKFNEEKLEWINKEHLKRLDPQVVEVEIKKRLPANWSPSVLSKIIPLIYERINKWSDVNTLIESGEFEFLVTTPTLSREMIICPKKLRKGKEVSFEEIKKHLEEIKVKISSLNSEFGKDEIKNVIWDYATTEGRGIVLWALRYTLSGRERSPDPFEIASLIGKEETLKRIDNAIKLL